jgi:hypothetical protein
MCLCGCGQECALTYRKGHARKGKAMSEEHKRKISLATKGQKRDGSHMKGRPGRTYTEAQRLQYSVMAKAKGYGKWMSGKRHSEETIEKLSIAHKGHITANTAKVKISEKNKGSFNGMFGRSHSEEAKAKISISAKKNVGKRRYKS